MKKSTPKKQVEKPRTITSEETNAIVDYLTKIKAPIKISLFIDNCVIKETPTEKWFMYGHYNIKIKK